VFTPEDRENHPDFPELIPHFSHVIELVSEDNVKEKEETY